MKNKVIKILKIMLILMLTGIVLALAAFFINDQVNKKVFVTKYTYENSEIPAAFDGYKILLISDLHEAPFADQIINHINDLSPDMIVITGDMPLLPNYSITTISKVAAAVKDIPIYAVSGNHETQGAHYNEIVDAMNQSGITVIDNDSVCIEKGEDSFLLLGIKDPEHNIVSPEQLEEIKNQIESEFPDGPCFSILLCHRSNLYEDIKDTSADLILSGHMHGGIMRIPFLGGVRGKNDEKWFPSYEYGMYIDDENADLIASGGCDKNPNKRRYFNPPEVVLITLESGDD